jgi:hypothetical protein
MKRVVSMVARATGGIGIGCCVFQLYQIFPAALAWGLLAVALTAALAGAWAMDWTLVAFRQMADDWSVEIPGRRDAPLP